MPLYMSPRRTVASRLAHGPLPSDTRASRTICPIEGRPVPPAPQTASALTRRCDPAPLYCPARRSRFGEIRHWHRALLFSGDGWRSRRRGIRDDGRVTGRCGWRRLSAPCCGRRRCWGKGQLKTAIPRWKRSGETRRQTWWRGEANSTDTEIRRDVDSPEKTSTSPQKDRELIARLREKDRQELEQAILDLCSMRCRKCGRKLGKTVYQHVRIDRCTGCGGVGLDPCELRDPGARGAHELVRRAAVPRDRPRGGQPLATANGAVGEQRGSTQERRRAS